jgi:signal peptidase I
VDPVEDGSPADRTSQSGRSEQADTASEAEAQAGRGPSWLLLVGIALLAMVLVRSLLVQSFYVPSGSMEPTIEPGDRILVNKVASGTDLRRGDVVVFDGTTTFAAADRTPHQDDGVIGRTLSGLASLVGVDVGEQDFIKRVVGLPGDHVVCCDADGHLTVNGTSVDEPYLFPGDRPSDLTFDVTVPANRLWVMGDHRGDSADSRSHLGDPGGGTVSVDDVVGRAVATYWPLSRLGRLSSPTPLARIPHGATP